MEMRSAAKRDFGSFHSSNVEELLNIPEDRYSPPDLPFEPPVFDNDTEFGLATKKAHFYIEEDWTFINHGAFGGALKQALTTAQTCQVWTERQPLRFLDRQLLPIMVYVTRQLAKFVGCDCRDLALMENATTALNTIINSVPLGPGDTVFCFSVTYGAVKKMLRWACEKTGASLQEVDISFPIQNREQIINCVRDNLRRGTKLAVFDHIPSNTPYITPLEEILPICRERNVPVLLDGAHALGMLPLNLQALDPDYYVSNAHKWFCCPKGTAFMYVRQGLQASVRPLIVSHGFGSGFSSEFVWSGLRDYSPFLAMLTVLDFWEMRGPELIRKYMYDLCRRAGHLLTEAWGTSLAAPEDMFGAMCLVELPQDLYRHNTTVDYSAAEAIQNVLYHQYSIEVPVKSVGGKLYVRISAHIYNTLSDYQTLADAILDLKKTNLNT